MDKIACTCGSISFDYCMTTNANLEVAYKFVCKKCSKQYALGFNGDRGAALIENA